MSNRLSRKRSEDQFNDEEVNEYASCHRKEEVCQFSPAIKRLDEPKAVALL